MKTKLTATTKKTSARSTSTKMAEPTTTIKRISRVRKASHKAPPADPVPVNSTVSRPGSKKGTIEAMVRRPEGTAISDLMAATGWQEHSIRAALTGLRKAGCTIVRERNDQATRYRIVGTA